jgi:hypothetical protein
MASTKTNAAGTTIKVLKGPERQKIHAHLEKTNQGDDAQTGSTKFLSFGSDNQAVKGLKDLLGMDDQYANMVIQKGEEMMKREIDALQRREGDPQDWFHNPHENDDQTFDWKVWVPNQTEVVDLFNYVVNEPSSEKRCPNGIRDHGRGGVSLEHFMSQEQCAKAGLAREHVIALRLYTTAMYKYINAPLRDSSLYRDGRHPLAAVVFYIFQGIKLLRNCADDVNGRVVLWRGVKSVKADQNFLENGGTELAPMSTTTELDVALGYLNGMTLSKGAVLFKIVVTNKLNMGAVLTWLSAFPSEAEVLYPPMTYLEVEKQYMRDENGEELDTEEPRQEVVREFFLFLMIFFPHCARRRQECSPIILFLSFSFFILHSSFFFVFFSPT